MIFDFSNILIPLEVKYQLDIIYLPHSCEAIRKSFYLTSNVKLPSDVASADMSVHFLNFVE